MDFKMSQRPTTAAVSGTESEDSYESAHETTPMQSQNTDPTEVEDFSRYLQERKEKWQNLLSYWLLGLTNNFAYVVMLSAAHDILSNDFTPKDDLKNSVQEGNGTNPRDCNTLSTGTVLLADIIPSLIVKVLAPFFALLVHLRVSVVVGLCSVAFLLVGLATSKTMAIIGVMFASAAAGLGETTFLAYSANFHRNVVSTWSSGTGGAGVFGAVSYAGLTSAGLSPRSSVLLMLIIPALMSISFWVILRHPENSKCSSSCMNRNQYEEQDEEQMRMLETTDFQVSMTLQQKLEFIPSLLKYMIPVSLVYVAEYLINQGLLELIYFPEDSSWLSHHEQYRWYQVIYQVGVLISRSSVNFITIHHIWKTSVLQWLNLILFLTCAVYWWLKSIWIIFFLIFWEGLLGGAAYVNTFYRISKEIDESKKEFAMSITSLSDSLGVTLAGFLAIPLHNIICKLPI